jgi:hypothetical protein
MPTRRELIALPLLASLNAQPQRKRREDSFWGIHLDLHANGNDTELGRDLSEAMVEEFLREVKPDYVQYDCKGHNGHLAYPSKVSKPAAGIQQDSLAIWRKVTARQGVGLYAHFSGVWDTLAIEEHPEWARLNAEGKPDGRATSTFGDYVAARMLPQLEEAAQRYDLDGVWVDGDCWATGIDYSPTAAAAWKQLTGRESMPRDNKDPDWQRFLEMQREQFRIYVRRYAEAMRKKFPRFQIASNWLYSTYAPEKPTLPVDFLSGDYLGNAAIPAARLEARYLAQTGKPWDLMAWGFQQANSNAIGHLHKPAVQLQQEASVVLAQGGGFQVYYQPTRAGRLDQRLIKVMGEVGRYCLERKPWSWRTESASQIAILFSGRTLYRQENKLFGGWGKAAGPARGFLDAVVESGFSVDVLPDWKLEAASRYDLLIVPDWADIGEEVRDAVLRFVAAGKSALIAGAQNAALFSERLGFGLRGGAAESPAWLADEELFTNARGLWQEIVANDGKVLEQRYPTYDARRTGLPAAVELSYERGSVVMMPGPIGQVAAATHAPVLRKLIHRLVRRLHQPMVWREGPPVVELALRRRGSQWLAHLLNCGNMQVAGEYAALDYVAPAAEVRLALAPGRQIRRAVSEPAGSTLSVTRSNNGMTIDVPKLQLHSIVAFEL